MFARGSRTLESLGSTLLFRDHRLLQHIFSLSEVPFPVSVDDAVACASLPLRRQRLLLTYSLHVQPRRISGVQPVQLSRILSMRHLAVGDSTPVKNTFRRVSHWVHEPSSSTGA
jgi:hypothetical protein